MAGFGQNDEVIAPAAKPFGANDEVVSGGQSAQHGATGSWGGFTEGVKDAVTAPFKPENWKSPTDNPLVNPLRSEFETPDLMTPQNTANSHAESADIQNRINLVKNGHMPVSPYEIGSRVTSAVMAGTPEAIRSGAKVIPFGRIGAGVSAATPGVAEGVVRMLPFVGKPIVEGAKQAYSGIRSGIDAFRGPEYGPEVAPKGYALPYGAFNNYHPPMTPSEPLPNLGEQGMARQSIYTPAAPSPEPINRVSLPEGVNPPVERQTPAAPSPVVLSPSGSFGSGPQSGFSSASVRPATADEIAFENAPRRIVDPLESKIITPPPASVPETPAAYRARVTQSRSKFDANRKRN